MYKWQFWDKRNRLCHNMIMEHFDLHKEQLEDLVVDLVKHRDTKLKGLQDTLRQGRASAPLFDTAGWVDSWELSLGAMVEHMATGLSAPSHLVV